MEVLKKMKANYLNLLEKNVKRCFKGKVKVTLALIVSLMINGVAFGVEEVPIKDGEAIWENTISSDTGKGIEVIGDYESENGLLTPKVVVDITNSGKLIVTNTDGVADSEGVSSGIYIPGTDKLTEFFKDDISDGGGNSSFTVTNEGMIDVTGSSAYGVHVKFPVSEDIVTPESSTEKEDPLYAYPDIDISNIGVKDSDGIYVKGEVEAEGIKINTPFSKVDIDNTGKIIANVAGKIDSEDGEGLTFGGATGINLFIPAEVEVAENPDPEWDKIGISIPKEEEEISALPMKVNIDNTGNINANVINKDVARIMGINVGEYDDHTLTEATEFIEPVAEDIVVPQTEETATDPALLKAISALATESPVSKEVGIDPEGSETASTSETVALTSSKKGHKGGSSGSGGCKTKPLDALVFNNITNKGNINISGEKLSAVQAVGINSRMSEGTQGTIKNEKDAKIIVDVKMENARQTKMAEDPTAGIIYGINTFNSGRPSRANVNNEGDITVNGTILEQDEKKTAAENPVGIQSFGIKAKSRGRDSVADINNTGNILVTSIEKQNKGDMDYTYYEDTEGKEIFGARAVGVAGTTAGRGAYSEITNGGYDLTLDQDLMDDKRDGEEVNIYEKVTEELKNQYDQKLTKSNTYDSNLAKTGAKIIATASSDYGYAQAKGIWSTSEAIENSQFVYNSEDSKIKAEATAPERGAEALGIESVSYQNTVINQGLIAAVSNGKTATGIGILAEVSTLEEEEMNEHAKKPESIGPEVGKPYILHGNGKDHQGGTNSGDEKNLLTTASFDELNIVSNDILLERFTVSDTITTDTVKTDTVATATKEKDESKGKDDSSSKGKKPEMGTKNKYILNTGEITVDVNGNGEESFAFGAGIASSKIVPETITGMVPETITDKVVSFFKTAIAPTDDKGTGSKPETNEGGIDGAGGATERYDQNITNNGTISVNVKGKNAVASGISSLTKVEAIFDSDGDGVSDSVDEKPLDASFAHDLDGDGTDDRYDHDADGDGFYNEKYINSLSPEKAEGLLVDYFDNDSDNDGISNRMDNDDDGDGTMDIKDDKIDPIGTIKFVDGSTNGFVPITDTQYEKLTDTPGGMPENLVETSGIVEAEEVIHTNIITNNRAISVTAVSEDKGGMAIANGIATDVVWNGFEKPEMEPATKHAVEEGAQEIIIEKNYNTFTNNGKISATATANAEDGTAAAFGIRSGSYYTDEAAAQRTPITKMYSYGLTNNGVIDVTASGSEARAFGIMDGHPGDEEDLHEDFVRAKVVNTGDIYVSHDGKDSEGYGIMAFANQQIEYLPEVTEGGVFLAAVEEDDHEETITITDETVPNLVFEDYVVKDPEKAEVVVENSGYIKVSGNGQNYGIYAGINPAPKVDKEVISVKEIDLTGTAEELLSKGITIKEDPILVDTQNGNDGESVTKQIGTLYIVTDGEGEYKFVIHAPEDKGEEMPDKIYVVDKGGNLSPDVKETYKIGERDLRVSNSGTIKVNGKDGVGIYLASEGTINNSGTILAAKAIVTSNEKDTINLNNGSEIYGDIETGGGDDILNISSKTKFVGNINLAEGNDNLIIESGALIGDINGSYAIDGGIGYDEITLGEGHQKNIINTDINNFENAKILGDWTLDDTGNLDLGEGTFILDKDSTLVIDMEGTSRGIKRGKITASKAVIDGRLVYDIEKVNKLGVHNFDYQFKDGIKVSTSSGDEVKAETNTYAWDARFVDGEGVETNVENPVSEARSLVSNSAVKTDTPLLDTVPDTSSIAFERVGFQELTDQKNDGLARVLDSDYETNSNTELRSVYSTLENEVLSTDMSRAVAVAALNTALEDMEGTEYAAYPFINLSISRAFGDNAKSFMDSTDSNIFNDENASMVDTKSDSEVHQYANILGNSGKYDNSDTENFDFDTYGVILGNDKKLESGDRLGITYGYAETNVDYDDGGSGETSTFHVGGYHKKEGGKWLLKSNLAFDYNKNDVDRVVWIGSDKYEPNTNFNSYIISAGSEISYDYNIGNLIVRPLAGLNYSRIEQDSFKEDTVIGLEKDSEGFNSLASEVGIKAIKEFYVQNSRLKLHFDISWLHEYGDVYDDQDLKLTGDSYKISGLGMNDDAYRIGMGLEANTNNNWSFNVKYSYDNGSSYDGHRISTGIRYKF